jgi:hypothetical protein
MQAEQVIYDVRRSAERDELRRLVDELPEDEVSAAQRRARAPRLASEAWPPRWFGAGHSARTDTAARSEELLEDGFGRRS